MRKYLPKSTALTIIKLAILALCAVITIGIRIYLVSSYNNKCKLEITISSFPHKVLNW